MQQKPLFITFEGIDGCGKSTQVHKFTEYLAGLSKYNHILLTREPYKSREIREILRQDPDPYSQARKLAELFLNDRTEHLQKIIHPALNSGIHVISDRYKLSTLAYQSTQGIPVGELIKMHSGLLAPDLTFIVDVPVEVAVKRMKKDSRQEHKFEANLGFLTKLRQRYLELPSLLPEEKIVVIDGSKDVYEVFEQVKKAFHENINL